MKPFNILLYYCYTHIENAEQFAADHLKFCKELGIKGRIIVAEEGLNGTVSGTPEQCETYMAAVKSDPRFANIDFKCDASDTHAFQKMHVRYKAEIVHLGVRGENGINPNELTGKHLSPSEFLAMKDREDVVLVDMRSNYEHQLGKFKNAVTLDLENFRELPHHLDKLKPFKDKKVITYCTGGIKCEKASALLLKNGFNEVYQLHGGIIKYGQEVGGVDFEGDCYVFDNRIQVAVNKVNPTVVSVCHICNSPSKRMVNCANPECNEHLTICDNCGVEYEGACSTECKVHPRKRPYNAKGYYVKPGV